MSQHIFEQDVDEERYYVQIGWDKPMQRYYGVVIQWVDDPAYEQGGYYEDDQPVWSNLYFDYDVNLDDISDACVKLGLTIPDGLIENVIRDKDINAVNERYYYKDGTIEHHSCESSGSVILTL